MWENGEDLRAPWLMHLHHQRKFPSLTMCKQWIHQYQAEGNVLPMQALGNSFSTHEVHGQDLVNLAMYWMVHPKAYIDKVHANVHNCNPVNPPYSQSQIYCVELRLGLFWKAASTTSNLADSPVNLFKRHEYWSQAFPDGVAGESTRDLIDIDESGYRLNSQNRSFGKVSREKRYNARGMCKNGDGGVNLLMAILGDERDGHSFSLMFFFDFMLELCNWLVVNHPGHQFLFPVDNLNIHKHPMIIHLIYSRSHRVVFRAPYWSWDGSIEYVFNTLQTRLQSDHIGVDDEFALVNKINNIIGLIPSFKQYFLHAGFPDN
jgi:hypothetical protein